MRDEERVLIVLDNEDDVDDDYLLDSDQMKQDMYIELVDQLEFASLLSLLSLWSLMMNYEIQNEVFHLS